ncbi:54S ribosomal protein L9, mitochondrial [Cyphellophora attinorum]|uniref:Large ribosomal subunit protein uL3m n=1 Tax=Cyphellophora attinorum TaxID=1664694 RepID=A0A0N0NJN1_9EURO|nr:54S ribosomal protein L9, mitochondrial [Phialophora attinorum]KPI36849.1 54S ribosomal protein L9, mitochondrial [Phialophora attinorum]
MPPKAPVLVAIPLPPAFLLPRSILQPSTPTIQKRTFGIRSIDRPRHDRYHPKSLAASQEAAHKRKELADALPYRTGALAIKKGMTSLYDEEGKLIPATILQFDRNQVVLHKTRKVHGYFAVCVGAGVKAAKNVPKAELGQYSVQGVSPKRYLQEFRVRDERGLLPVGSSIHADWFQPGQFIDARSHCKGKGWQGVMKRWGFHGQDRSHGVSLTHRSMGSAGGGQGSGSRVHPGKKMAGNMGGQRVTMQNVKVLQSDAAKGILLVKGAVSGPKGCVVMVQDALKKPWIMPPPLIDFDPKDVDPAEVVDLSQQPDATTASTVTA